MRPSGKDRGRRRHASPGLPSVFGEIVLRVAAVAGSSLLSAEDGVPAAGSAANAPTPVPLCSEARAVLCRATDLTPTHC